MVFLPQSLDAAYDFLTAQEAVSLVELRFGDGLTTASLSASALVFLALVVAGIAFLNLRVRSVLARSGAQTVMPTRMGIESAMREGRR